MHGKQNIKITQVNSKSCLAAILNLRGHQLLLHGDVNRNELKCVKMVTTNK